MIKVTNLNKSFGSLEVLKKIDLEFVPGQITYIVGPNGSGKSTLIKIILGLVKSDSGDVWVGDYMLNGDCHYRDKIGYMPQSVSFPENLTVTEVFKMLKDLRNNKDDLDEYLIKELNLDKELNKRLGNLSGGTKQKVSAAITFLFNPSILILDEPTAGLDPVSSSILKDKIKKEKENGRTIILTSHILSELEELADNVVFILEGSIKFSGKINHLIEKTSSLNLERAMAALMNGQLI
ncbi:MAG: ABC transporter ATP-binding protein [Bacteroidetes bacterium]|nr:ABC transporter ATP-binding protein [Bacteroidota bacterium]